MSKGVLEITVEGSMDCSKANPAREVVRCRHCFLVQFRTVSDLCRRCAEPLPSPLRDLASGSSDDAARSPAASNGDTAPRAKALRECAIGPRLKQLRESRNLTQAHIAKKARVPRTYISRIEHSHLVPGLMVVRRLADALAVGVLDLFSDQSSSNEESVVSGDSYWNSFVMYFRQLRADQQSAVLAEIRGMLRQRLLQQRLSEYQAVGRPGASFSRSFAVHHQRPA